MGEVFVSSTVAVIFVKKCSLCRSRCYVSSDCFKEVLSSAKSVEFQCWNCGLGPSRNLLSRIVTAVGRLTYRPVVEEDSRKSISQQ